MEELLAITKVLGEENEKRFKDAVTDLLIEQVKDDLENLRKKHKRRELKT